MFNFPNFGDSSIRLSHKYTIHIPRKNPWFVGFWPVYPIHIPFITYENHYLPLLTILKHYYWFTTIYHYLPLFTTIISHQPPNVSSQEQLKSLDGWNFTTAALAQPDDEIAANRQRVLVRGPGESGGVRGSAGELLMFGEIMGKCLKKSWGPMIYG